MQIFFRGVKNYENVDSQEHPIEVLCNLDNVDITIDGERCLATVSRAGQGAPYTLFLSEPQYNMMLLKLKQGGSPNVLFLDCSLDKV